MNTITKAIQRFWRYHVTIRVRLTLWYLLVLGGVLIFFAAFIHNRIETSLHEETDRTLRLAANRTLAAVQIEGNTLIFTETDGLADVTDDFTLRLVSPQGEVLNSLGSQEPPVLNTLRAGFFDIKREGPHAEHQDWRILSTAIENDDGVIVGWLQVTRATDLHRMLNIMRDHFCLGLPVGIMVAGLGGVWLARQALRPIDHITRTARSINATDMQQRINYDGPADEVGRLAQTLDNMLDRLQAGFERERQFTGDAAHELRTPLTALKGQIGVALSQPRQADQYQATLRNLEDEVDRMIRLSSDLLLLARLDCCAPSAAAERIDLTDLLGALGDQVLPMAEEKQIRLVEAIPPGLAVSGNMDLLIRLFLNLLDNAIKYTPHEGTVTIRAEARAEQVAVAISDTGPGIASEHLPHLFERFFRGERDRARDYTDSLAIKRRGGAGLGLAIAQEIAHAHGGRVTVASTLGAGSMFTVELPTSTET